MQSRVEVKRDTHARKHLLLNDPDVKRWYENIAAGSVQGADKALGNISTFCERTSTTPKSLVELGRKSRKAVEDLLEDYIRRLEGQGYSPNSVSSYYYAVKSWLDRNEIELKRRIKIRDYHKGIAYKTQERVPTYEELEKLLTFRTTRNLFLRAKASASLLAFAGPRIEVLGNYDGTDGLKVSDLPELDVKSQEMRFTNIPAQVIVRRTLSKAGHQYFSFLGKEGCERLLEYFNLRVLQGEDLNGDSPIISTASGYEEVGQWKEGPKGDRFLTSTEVSNDLRKLIRASGFDFRPYLLRSYFDSMMLVAESRGALLSKDHRTWWMGHKGTVEMVYTLHKTDLPSVLMDELRNSYGRAEQYLYMPESEHVKIQYEKLKAEHEGRLQAVEKENQELKQKLAEQESAGSRLDEMEKAIEKLQIDVQIRDEILKQVGVVSSKKSI